MNQGVLELIAWPISGNLYITRHICRSFTVPFVIMEVKDPIKLFMRWANWCEQRDRHFTSGPVEDVVSWAIW